MSETPHTASDPTSDPTSDRPAVEPDVQSDPAEGEGPGTDWASEGGADEEGPATAVTDGEA